MSANSEGSGETVRMRRLARGFAGRLCDKYHNLMSWLKILSSTKDNTANAQYVECLIIKNKPISNVRRIQAANVLFCNRRL